MWTLRLARIVGLYWLAVGMWWAIHEVNVRLAPTRVFVPPVDKTTFVQQVGLYMAIAVGIILALRVAYVVKRPGLHKYGTAKWNRALTDAKLIKDDEPQARMVGKVRVVDETTLITLKLPPGLTVTQVAAKAEHVAASMDVAVERLHLSKLEGRGSMLRIRIDPPARDLKPRHVDLPETTSWRDPVLLGRDMRGRDITAPVWDIGQWLVGGITGSGKTTLLRLLAAHYALDPDAIIWGCDGKGSRDDWGPLKHRVARWVDVTDPDASASYIAMLRDVGNEVAARNKAGGRDHPGMLVILEEATALRAGLDNGETSEADKLLVRVVQTCRSANVLVVTAAQRPAASLMSSNVRAQAGVGVCMRVRSMTDAEMVLGYRPEVALPEQVGRALLDTGDGTPRAILVDHMTYEVWRDLCRQWRPLRVVPEPVDEPEAVEPEAVEEPEDAVFDEPEPEPITPLLIAVEVALKAAGRRLTTSELWKVLPDDLRTPNAATLGKALTAAGMHPVKGNRGNLYGAEMLPHLLPLEWKDVDGVERQ